MGLGRVILGLKSEEVGGEFGSWLWDGILEKREMKMFHRRCFLSTFYGEQARTLRSQLRESNRLRMLNAKCKHCYCRLRYHRSMRMS